MDELKHILERVRMACGEDDYKVMNAVVETLSYLTHLAKDASGRNLPDFGVIQKREDSQDFASAANRVRNGFESGRWSG